ncbi:hypothetical protein [Flavilitoribacter nigricans]|uniref:ABC transporter ATPase n=1 Tax=Flavilitoribacter nigricans (strain ATCC 23147 / DSM 23189 / NBRC 102662 / NCIMB 1420 / SS-2) TaxID=1122177 RepID=A0A2D0NIX2_FLAN2|nr:hypothetical protein [Flavilitoribacter nigricans]PHN08340.1 hypothetical protein CRP01_00045 [Flavilitoribacter nigricans DSM 23189 = NBRC 102662]
MTLPEVLPDSTRVWIYQTNQPIAEEKVPEVRDKIQSFVRNWVSHNRALRSHGDLLHNRFVVLMVDESQAGASGCSIDSSVHFLKRLQAEYGVDLFDRMVFSFKKGDEVISLDRDAFARWYAEGKIDDETLVFDTLVNNKKDLEENWMKPLKNSWHRRMV